MAAPEGVSAEVAIIGAGPAGVAAAAALCREGRQVVLIDPCRPPPTRLESLPVNGLPAASALGLADVIAAAMVGRARTFRRRWRVLDDDEDLGHAGPVLVDRTRLAPALRCAAERVGARLVAAHAGRPEPVAGGFVVPTGAGPVAAPIVIDARGRAGLPRHRESLPSLVALPFESRAPHPPERPELSLEALAIGWAFQASLPTGRVSGAVFLSPDALAGLDASRRTALAVDLLGRAVRADPSGAARRTVAPGGLAERGTMTIGAPVPARFGAAAEVVPAAGLIRVGDTALARDPIASHGLVHALRTGLQAAAAAVTMLDPGADSGAATSFLEARHQEAVRAARTATLRAYNEQDRFESPFWTAVPHPPAKAVPLLAPAPGVELALSGPLVRAAALAGGRIVWADAIELRGSGERIARVGPLSARQLACLCDPPAPLAVLEARLAQVVPPDAAHAILGRLVAEGSLIAANPSAGQAETRASVRA
jgi:hypothetical protein